MRKKPTRWAFYNSEYHSGKGFSLIIVTFANVISRNRFGKKRCYSVNYYADNKSKSYIIRIHTKKYDTKHQAITAVRRTLNRCAGYCDADRILNEMTIRDIIT